MELWNSILVGLAFIYSALLATPSPARGTGVRHGSSGHPDDIDEQGTSSPVDWRSAFENPRVVGEIVTGELRVAKLNHQIRYVVAMKDRERGIRIVLKETVLSLTPERNEPCWSACVRQGVQGDQ